jgi:ferredoxin--NADP+ reductase
MPTASQTRDPGPELPEVAMHLHIPPEPAIGRVTKNEICTSPKAAGFIRHVEIDVAGSRLEGGFRVGQSFGVLAPGTDERGRPHALRLYSIASPTRGEDGGGRVLSTTVKRLIDERWQGEGLYLGLTSNYLCDLRPGDELRLTGPNGKRFLLPARPEEHDYLFIATGTGIAPFRGMLKELIEQEKAPGSRAALIMGAPYETDLIYHGWLDRLTAEHGRFTYFTALSRQPQIPQAPQGPGRSATSGEPIASHDRMYVQDRLLAAREDLLPLLCSERTLIYICGLVGMELGVIARLADFLPTEWLARYVSIDPEVMGASATWDRQMLGRRIKPTRRMFIETY